MAKIILKSVIGDVGQKYYIQPCPDKYGQYPPCVKHVDSHDDMILTDKELNSGKVFIKESEVFTIKPGQEFDLDDPMQNAIWESIKHSDFIATDRYEKDERGNYKIDGTIGFTSKTPRYGKAELYVYKPGEETEIRVKRKETVLKACTFISEAPMERRYQVVRVLGNNMNNMPSSEVTATLYDIAEKDPQKIIDLFSGTTMELRILLCDAIDKKVITIKDKIYLYNDTINLGTTAEAVIDWMQNPKNKNTLELIKHDVNPELEKAKAAGMKAKN